MLEQKLASSPQIKPRRSRGWHGLGLQPVRAWSFVVTQWCEAPRGGHTFSFFMDSFTEALSAAEAVPTGWKHEAIWVVLSKEPFVGSRQEVRMAYLLDSVGFLCCLSSGLQLLDPLDKPSSSTRRRLGACVYG